MASRFCLLHESKSEKMAEVPLSSEGTTTK